MKSTAKSLLSAAVLRGLHSTDRMLLSQRMEAIVWEIDNDPRLHIRSRRARPLTGAGQSPADAEPQPQPAADRGNCPSCGSLSPWRCGCTAAELPEQKR